MKVLLILGVVYLGEATPQQELYTVNTLAQCYTLQMKWLDRLPSSIGAVSLFASCGTYETDKPA